MPDQTVNRMSLLAFFANRCFKCGMCTLYLSCIVLAGMFVFQIALSYWYEETIAVMEKALPLQGSDDVMYDYDYSTINGNNDTYWMPNNTDRISGWDTEDTTTPMMSKYLKVIIMTLSRSGSSFVGSIFKHIPDTFYSFEPLRFVQLEDKTALEAKLLGENASKYLDHMMECNFKPLIDDSEKFFPAYSNARNIWIPIAFPVHKTIAEATATCVTKQNIAVKIIRTVNIKYLLPLLKDPEVLILNLVRDPRGRLSSQVKLGVNNVDTSVETYLKTPGRLDWFRTEAISQCQIMEENLEAVKEAMQDVDLQNRIAVVRYEDVAYHPKEMSEKFFRVFGRKPAPDFYDWLRDVTTKDSHLAYIPVRNSSKTAEEWREVLPYDYVKTAQDACRPVLVGYGYKELLSEELQHDPRMSVVDVLPKELPSL